MEFFDATRLERSGSDVELLVQRSATIMLRGSKMAIERVEYFESLTKGALFK